VLPLQNLFRAAAFSISTAFVSAQAPEIIHYTFNGLDAANTATSMVGPGTPNGSVTFGPGSCGNGAAIVASTGPQIATNWQVDFGMSSWTIGMWIDLSGGGNAFQYFYGASTTGGFRCFCNGAAGVNGIMLRTLGNDVTLPGGSVATGPTHCAWVYDSAVPEVRGYVNGINVITVAQANLLNINATAADFNIMQYTSISPMLVGNTMDDFRVYRRAISQAEIDLWVAACGGGLGTSYCGPAVPNSTGASGAMSATGSASVASNDLTLTASSLPNNAFGYFLTSRTQGLVLQPGGSLGVLCLGGNIGRYVGPGQIQNTGVTGAISLLLDLTQTPTPTGPVAVAAGETWSFQAWHRDSVGGLAVSNFTDGLEVTFN
jgi:hypothetical protein